MGRAVVPAAGRGLAELRQRYVAARKMIGLLPVGTRPGDDTPGFWSLPRADFDRWQAEGMAPWLDELHALWPQASARFAHLRDAGQMARAVYRDAVMTRWPRPHGAGR